jgi:hypothetical protein
MGGLKEGMGSRQNGKPLRVDQIIQLWSYSSENHHFLHKCQGGGVYNFWRKLVRYPLLEVTHQ